MVLSFTDDLCETSEHISVSKMTSRLLNPIVKAYHIAGTGIKKDDCALDSMCCSKENNPLQGLPSAILHPQML